MSTGVRNLRLHEERVCSSNHFWGGVTFLVLIVCPLVLGMIFSRPAAAVIGCVLFCFSIATTLLISGTYHGITELGSRRRLWQMLDHNSIYLLIATTHSTCMMVIPDIGFHPQVLIVVWIVAAVGIVLKAPLVREVSQRVHSLLDWAGVVTYLGLGWMGLVILHLSPLGMATLIHSTPVQLLLAGGAAYSTGVLFYVRDADGDHNRFHWFVLAGAKCHFLAHIVALLAERT